MKRIKHLLFSLIFIASVGGAMIPVTPVGAVTIDPIQAACDADANSTVCKGKNDNITNVITTVVNVLLFVVGIIAVLMIIVGGITYATSGGDSAGVTRAKGMIMGAIIGLLIAFFAFAIVNWVVLRFVHA